MTQLLWRPPQTFGALPSHIGPVAPLTPLPPPAATHVSISEADAFWAEIQNEIFNLQHATRQIVLDNLQRCDGNNAVHVALWNMRYNPNLIGRKSSILCPYEALLSAHQV